LVQLAKHYGATVIGTTSTADKAQLARSAGADHIILYTQEDVAEKVKEFTSGKGNLVSLLLRCFL
jgi:NADPH2:quinone reductase